MTDCSICKLKTKPVRRVVRNIVQLIQKTEFREIKSFKDHTQEDPLSKLLNNFLKGQVNNNGDTERCKHHKELKQKIIQYIPLREE